MQTIKRIKCKSLCIFSTTWMNSLTDLCLPWDPHIGHYHSITSKRDTLIVVSLCHLLVPCPVPNNNYVSCRAVMLICLIKKSMCSPLHTCGHCPLKHWVFSDVHIFQWALLGRSLWWFIGLPRWKRQPHMPPFSTTYFSLGATNTAVWMKVLASFHTKIFALAGDRKYVSQESRIISRRAVLKTTHTHTNNH